MVSAEAARASRARRWRGATPTTSSSTRTLGVILGGRLGYVLFYKPADYFHDPVQIVRLWDGGMSFHGGVIGVSLGILYLAWRQKLDWLRIHDYVACCVPFGLFFGRLANFVNGEFWGGADRPALGRRLPDRRRRSAAPSEPALRGRARGHPAVPHPLLACSGRPAPATSRASSSAPSSWSTASAASLVEFVREPDAHLVGFAQATHLHMGQWLSLPMILGGLYLVVTAKSARRGSEPIAGRMSPTSRLRPTG